MFDLQEKTYIVHLLSTLMVIGFSGFKYTLDLQESLIPVLYLGPRPFRRSNGSIGFSGFGYIYQKCDLNHYNPTVSCCRREGGGNGQEPTESNKQPIKTRYLGHVTDYQPIRYQYFLVLSVTGNDTIVSLPIEWALP